MKVKSLAYGLVGLAVITAALILGTLNEGSDIRDLIFPAFALLAAGVVVQVNRHFSKKQ